MDDKDGLNLETLSSQTSLSRFLQFNHIRFRAKEALAFLNLMKNNDNKIERYSYQADLYKTLGLLMDDITVYVENYMTDEELLGIAAKTMLKLVLPDIEVESLTTFKDPDEALREIH